MTNLAAWRRAAAVLVMYIATAGTSNAQTFTTLWGFDYTDGSNPGLMSLAQGTDGSLYGTTVFGGPDPANGTVFKIGHNGLLTLHSFCQQGLPCVDGSNPSEGLMLALDGNFYGTTPFGGDPTCNAPLGCGTVFRISREGTLTTVHTFEPNEGLCCPSSGLVEASDGYLYGTSGGGDASHGTVFRMTPDGTLTVLYNFDGSDGADPQGTLLQATDGNLYGITEAGGASPDDCGGVGCGTAYKITPRGKLTTLYSFCSLTNCADGATPMSGLTQGADGNLYGTTYGGVAYGYGTVFRLTLDGTLTTLYSFCTQQDCTDGATPIAGLTLATDGDFYGTTQQGGSTGRGTLFKITATGTLTTLHSFCTQHDCPDGSYPYGGVTQRTDGDLYGTTYTGGRPQSSGVIYRLSEGLSPFVTFVRAAGRIGHTGGILGQGFTGTTGVSLNGTPVSFTVESDTFIKATVPPGATTGYVTVTTPNGTLTSNVQFHVIP